MTDRFFDARTVRRIAETTARLPAWVDGAVASIIAVLAMLCAFSWPLDLHVPLVSSGDAIAAQYIMKSILEYGSYLENADVGAPFGATMYDYPIPEPTHHLLIRLLGTLNKDPFWVFNVFYLLSFATTAWGACWAMRVNGVSRMLAVAGGVAFALLPYHFFRLSHVFLASYFAAPVFCCYALRLASYRAPHIRGAATASPAALLLIAVAAGSGIYYAFFGCLFVAFAALLGTAQSGHTAPLRVGAFYVATIATVVAAALLPNAIYHFTDGGNLLVAQRNATEADFFGLRISQLLLPTPGHRVPLLDAFMTNYDKVTPIVNENKTVTLGLIGSIGFVVSIVSFLLFRRTAPMRLSIAGALIIAALLYATIGGFGSLFALFVTPDIRGLNRISVFLAFLSLYAFLIGAALPQRSTRLPIQLALAIAIVVIAVADQIPVHAIAAPNQKAFAQERAFHDRLHRVLPAGTDVFELPYTYFPESPHVLGSYAMMKPYLFGGGLRWNFGGMRGRAADLWNERASALPAAELVRAVSGAGFGAIYLDRRGYGDHAAALESELTTVVGAPVLEDDEKNVAVYRVPSAGGAAPFVVAGLGRNWHPGQGQKPAEDAWSSGDAELIVANPATTGTSVSVSFVLDTTVQRQVVARRDGEVLAEWNLRPGAATPVELRFVAGPGVSRLVLDTDRDAAPAGNGDRRKIALRIRQLDCKAR